MTKEIKGLNIINLDYEEDDNEMVWDEADSIIRGLINSYENRYHTAVTAIALGGQRFNRYNSAWGGRGLTVVPTNRGNLAVEMLNAVGGRDYIGNITIKGNRLVVETSDHDGTTTAVATFWTEAREDRTGAYQRYLYGARNSEIDNLFTGFKVKGDREGTAITAKMKEYALGYSVA